MLKKINYVLDRKQKINLGILLIIIFIGAFVELLGVSAVMPLINVAMQPETIDEKWYFILISKYTGITDANQMILFLAVLLIIIYILKNIYVMAMYSLQYRFVFNNQQRLSVRMMKSYMQQDYLFHVSKNVAEFQRNITSDVNGFFTVALNVLQFLAEFSVSAVLVIFLLIQDWVSTVAIAALLFLFMGIFTVFFRKVLVKIGEESRQANVLVTKWLFQAFSGIKEIKVANKESFFITNYDKNYKDCARVQRQQSILTYLPKPVMETVCICSLMLAMIIKIAVMKSDIVSFVTTLSVFAVAAFRMLPSFNKITGYISGMMFNKPAIDSVYRDLKEIERLMGQKTIEQKDTVNITLNKSIQFNDVSFHYSGSDKWILKDANLEIQKNTSVALIGASGAGKTTAADLILGILEPQEGTVTIDGVDIKKCMKSWHEEIGYIPQVIYLMDDTIRANVAFGIPESEIDDTRIEKALWEAQLDQFVQALPDGLDTMIGDRGVKLSGGQRQRIGIARALYRNPNVLVLDEATSALDSDTEKEVMEAIDGLHGTRTLIVIAHRLSTIRKCDKIYEVGKGGFTERDKAEVLGN
ncbi:MAG: ABC transporter ATP-binding protein [Lachnospiraceae bacterium]|jgi:ABC-type multidrug transport system fused ATPase/permease subunit|nr:ABC transporter ATP-binding protein [Lachnospiraceae bacterium]